MKIDGTEITCFTCALMQHDFFLFEEYCTNWDYWAYCEGPRPRARPRAQGLNLRPHRVRRAYRAFRESPKLGRRA